MFRFLKELFHRPALRLGSLGYSRRGGARLRNERFASYIASNNRKTLDTDRKDMMLAGRRVFRQLLVVAALGLLVWVVMESAQAVGVF